MPRRRYRHVPNQTTDSTAYIQQIKCDVHGDVHVHERGKRRVINSDFKVFMEPKFNSVNFIEQDGKANVIAKEGGNFAPYDDKGNPKSTHQYTKREQSEIGELFLWNDYSWYRLNESGELEETER